MVILHVLSQFQVTGAEVFARELALLQQKDGHKIIIVSDTFSQTEDLDYRPQAIGVRSWLQRWKNILFLKKLIKAEKIDIVHAHSRAASWVCHHAVKGSNVPLVSHVHGRQHIHRSSVGSDIYGQLYIGVCPNLKVHLNKELKLPEEKVNLLPNGFHFPALQEPICIKGKQKVLIAGRTSGKKGELSKAFLENYFEQLATQYPNLEILFAGGDFSAFGEEFQNKVNHWAIQFPAQLKGLGFVKNLNQYISEADLVIGSGRVALEALALGKPLIAIGESLCVGLVTEQKLQEAISSNFGDMAALKAQEHTIVQSIGILTEELNSFLNLPKSKELISLEALRGVKHYFSWERIKHEVEEVYKRARMKAIHPEWFPILMFHKVVDEPYPTPHKIYVTTKTFRKQLQYLKRNGFTSITFKDYLNYKEGKLPAETFPKKPFILTFDDGYLNNYTHALPIIKEFGFRGVVFVLSNQEQLFNYWDTPSGELEMPLMHASYWPKLMAEGWEIGSHFTYHQDLTTLSLEEVRDGLLQSKADIEGIITEPVVSFAYPYGRQNEQIQVLVKEAGYSFAVVITEGGLHIEDKPFTIFRPYIFPQDEGFAFRKKTSSWYRAYHRKKKGS